MINTTPNPLPLPTTEAPDATWQTIRDTAVSDLRDGAWTDHNPSDPGITMLEASALSLADLHYRSANADFGDSPIVSQLWASSAHWSSIDLPADTESLTLLADTLATDTDRNTIDEHVRAATSRSGAIAALVSDPTLQLDFTLAAAAVRLLRAGTVRRAAMDLNGAVDGALEAVDGSQERALSLLKYDPGFAHLWDDEILDLFQLRRRRQLLVLFDRLQGQIADESDPSALEPFLLASGVTAEESPGFVAAMNRPPVHPEFFESIDGRSTVWPPTEIQSRTVEPITAEDYADLARGVPGVRRAWVTSGQRPGTGWDATALTISASTPGTVTILIESEADGPSTELELAVHRALALPGEEAEVDNPYGLFRHDLDRAAPRRVVCDQIGVSTLSQCPIEVRAALHVAVGSIDNRGTTIEQALARVADLFLEGRPESQPVADLDSATNGDTSNNPDIEGVWPQPPPAPTGWIPGEPIRLNEVTQRLADDPMILGVTDVSLRRPGLAWYRPTPGRPEEFVLPDDCLPRLADNDCVTVAFVLTEDL